MLTRNIEITVNTMDGWIYETKFDIVHRHDNSREI